MYALKNILLSLTFFFSSSISAQNIFDRISQLNKNDEVESCFELIDKFEEKFKTEEKWDSLIQLQLTAIPIHERRSGPEKVTELTAIVELLAKKHFSDEDELYLEVMVAKLRNLSQKGLLQECSTLADTIIQQAKKINNETLEAKAIIQKSWSTLRQYKPNEAIELANSALELKEHFSEDTMQLIFTYQVLGIAHNFLHQLDKAIKFNKKQLELIIKKFGPTHPNVGIASSQIAATCREEGDLKEALSFNLKAIKIYEPHAIETGITQYIRAEYFNLALVYDDLGEIDLSQQYLELSLDLGKEQYFSLENYHDYNALTENALKQNDFIKAKRYNDSALEIIENLESKSSYFYLSALGYKVNILYGLEQYEEAYRLGKDVYNRIEKIEDGSPKELITTAGILCDLALINKDTLQSNSYFEIYERGTVDYYSPINSEYFKMLMHKLEYYKATNRQDEIQAIVRQILNSGNPDGLNQSFAKSIPNSEMLDIIGFCARNNYEKLHLDKISIEDYQSFVEDVETYLDIHFQTVRTNARLSKEGLMLKSIYKPLIEHAAENNSSEMINYMEKVKSLMTRVLLQNHMINNKQDDLKMVDALNENLKSSQDSFNVEIYGEIIEQMEAFQSHKDSLYNADKQSYLTKYGINNWNEENLKNLLQKGELLIQYLQIDSALYYMAMNEDEYEIVALDYITIEQTLSLYLDDRDQLKSRELYNLLLPGELHTKYNNWLILPDHKLHFLNFEELLDTQGEYLLSTKSIRYAYSATVLQQQKILSQSNDANQGILSLTPGFAKQLKERYKEDRDSSWQHFLQQPFLINLAGQIDHMQSAESLTNEEATEINFKSKSPNYKILHFGTHGLLNHDSPLFSKLVLAKDSLEDGYLHVYEIYGQELNAELAVLSACNSGVGKIESSDGIVSLTQAFTHAGCPSVLMTLWEVDEKSTADILKLFYGNLEKGQKKADALRNAKRSFLDQSTFQYQDPYYWAGLVLIGDDEALFTSFPFGWLSAVLMCLIILGWIGRKYFTKIK